MSPHRFPLEERKRLSDDRRRTLQPADEMIDRMNPSEEEVCADLGCGTGYVTIPLAARVRRVIGFDVQREMLESLLSNAKDAKERIHPVVGEIPYLPFRSATIDRVLMINVAHEVEDRKLLSEEVYRVLSPGGKLTVVDFPKRPTSFGPPVGERLNMEEMVAVFPLLKLIKKWPLEEFYQLEMQKY